MVGLLAVNKIWRSNAGSEEKEVDLMTVDIAPESVYQVDLYWNYIPYSVNRKEYAASIDRAIELLNGEYAAVGVWVNIGTGSGNRVDFYDETGNPLAGYHIYTSLGEYTNHGELRIGSVEDPKSIKYKKAGEEDDQYLRELIDLLKASGEDSH